MPKDRDQMTPADPDDKEYLATHRGQGTGGTGLDSLPSELDDALGEGAGEGNVDPGAMSASED